VIVKAAANEFFRTRGRALESVCIYFNK